MSMNFFELLSAPDVQSCPSKKGRTSTVLGHGDWERILLTLAEMSDLGWIPSCQRLQGPAQRLSGMTTMDGCPRTNVGHEGISP